MKKETLRWHDFYDAYTYEDQRVTKELIDRLVQIDHQEVLEVIEDLTYEDEKLAQALLMQAIKDGVSFTIDDLKNLSTMFYEESLLYEGIKVLSKSFCKQDYQELEEVFDITWVKQLAQLHHIVIIEDDFLSDWIDSLDEVLAYLMQAIKDLKEVVSGGILDCMQSNLILASGKYAYQVSAQENVEKAKILLEGLAEDIKEGQEMHTVDVSFPCIQALMDIVGGNTVLKNYTIYRASKAGKQLVKIYNTLEKARNTLVKEQQKR